MRTAIVVIISVALGAVVGAVAAHLKTNPQLKTLAEERNTLQESKDRLKKELDYMSQRLDFIQVENQALEDQVAALQEMPRAARQVAQSSQQTEAPVEAAEPETMASANPDAGSFVSDESSNSPVNDTYRLSYHTRNAIEDKRQGIQEYLDQALATTTDPAEQQRLLGLQEHLQHVRDLYSQLRQAKDTKERQAILEAVTQSRTNLKGLVEAQRSEMLRDQLAANGVADAQQQSQIIQSLKNLQQTPYWSEPMLVWGMSAQAE